MSHDDDSPRPDWAEGLTEKEWLYCDEYLRTLSRAKAYAAIRSAVADPKYDYQSGYRYSQRPNVRKAIDKALTDRGVSRPYLMDRLASIIDADIKDFFEKDGRTLKNFAAMDENSRFAIVETTFDKFGNRGVKLADKLRAIEIIGKLLNLFTNKVEMSGPDGGPIEVSPGERLAEQLEALRQKLEAEDGGAEPA